MNGGAVLGRHDRLIVCALVAVVAALAWAYTVHQAYEMAAMDAAIWRDMNMSMNGMAPSWTPLDFALMLAMWTVMMAAMMLPGSAAVVAAFAAINRSRRERGAPYVPTAVFLGGYRTGIGILLLVAGAAFALFALR